MKGVKFNDGPSAITDELERRLERVQADNGELERVLAETTRQLYQAQEDLRRAERDQQNVSADTSERRRLELELRHAQRLESIGELAAGVAHEINTPIQFVSDGVRFIGASLDDLLRLIGEYRPLIDQLAASGRPGERPEVAALLARVARIEDDVELPFVQAELPRVVERTLEGLNRVATIVQALKQFSHPGNEDFSPVDVNDVIENALVVGRSEYRHVADVDLRLGDVGDIMGHRGDLGQVVLNLVVNAGHAIADRSAGPGGPGVRGLGGPGRITITTRTDGDGVTIEIADTGGGIPVEIRDRIFEPFFTTKEPGRGTGQGLALVHNRVVVRHGGRIEFDVEDGVGTTFRIWLPRKHTETRGGRP